MLEVFELTVTTTLAAKFAAQNYRGTYRTITVAPGTALTFKHVRIGARNVPIFVFESAEMKSQYQALELSSKHLDRAFDAYARERLRNASGEFEAPGTAPTFEINDNPLYGAF